MKEETIYTKLFALQQEVGKVAKNATNPFFKSKYFDVNGLIEHLTPLLAKHKLLLIQPIVNGSVVSKIVNIEDGVSVESAAKLPEISDPQKLGSCITYFRRYTLQSLLGLQAEDDDANVASGLTSPNTKATDKQWLNEGTEEFTKAKKFIKEGGTIADVRKKYAVSKKTEEVLCS